MKFLTACLFFLSLAVTQVPAAPAELAPPSLAGTWHINAARSTELSPWQSYDLVISIDGNRITLERSLAWGRRSVKEHMTLDTSRAVTDVPIASWPDNRNLGASLARPTKQVHATWVDERRILRLSTDLVLATQQGERPINILSDYKLSASGSQLTLIELRSTRNRPIVFVFDRVSPSASPQPASAP